jgi:3-oxoacid CoA-transferase
MDLASGAQRVIAMCEHTDSKGNPKLLDQVTFPVTTPGCVDIIVTDLALLRRPSRAPGARFVLAEIAAGFTVEEVLAVTGMTVDVPDVVRVMQENWI